MHIFLTREEKDKLAKWKYSVEDKSITTQIFNPWWNWVVKFIPNTVPPNIISLAGLLCILYYFHLAFNYASTHSRLISLLGVILVFAYQTLDAIDGKHARRTHKRDINLECVLA
jgi:ethanolaminephosphotransferase